MGGRTQCAPYSPSSSSSSSSSSFSLLLLLFFFSAGAGQLYLFLFSSYSTSSSSLLRRFGMCLCMSVSCFPFFPFLLRRPFAPPFSRVPSYNSPATRGPSPPPERPLSCVSADHGLQRLRVTAVRLAPRGAPEHAHHAVVLLEGRAPRTKFRMHLETRRAAETTTGAVRFFCLKHSPANLDPPLERRLNSHISANQVAATRWWPSVKLTRCRRLATETLWAICSRSACSGAT